MSDILPNCPLIILHKKDQNTLANLNCREGKVINDTLFFCSFYQKARFTLIAFSRL